MMDDESSCELDDAAKSLTEMKCFQRSPTMDRQILLPPTVSISTQVYDAADHIKVGSYYEIDHSKLPERTPQQLKSIRIVMVREKTKMRVSLRFPSMYSLREHISNSRSGKVDGKQIPVLEESHIMSSVLAAEVLYRRVTSEEIAERRNSLDFWAVAPIETRKISRLFLEKGPNKMDLTRGSCWSELNSREMVSWGKRRQVQFLSRHVEEKHEETDLSDRVIRRRGKRKYEEEMEQEEESEGDDDDEEEGEEEEEEEEEKIERDLLESTREETKPPKWRHLKRDHDEPTSSRILRTRKAKSQRQNKIVVYKQKDNNKRKVLKIGINRWSTERYKLAEENMLKIMKEMNAVHGNPMLRPALRLEVRKSVGDTGLLDHLLKHMSGKLAPGGMERFRRRHNADGAMEYWLESADLVNLRKEAGVLDPYWIPPPGWKLGDNPSQDPTCARDINKLKEDMAKVKKDMRELVAKKQEEEDLAIVLASPHVLSAANQDAENDGSILPLKEMYMGLVNRKANIEKQLMEISHSMTDLEEEMRKMKSRMDEPKKTAESAETQIVLAGSPTPSIDTERVTKEAIEIGSKTPPVTKMEDKAAKIERLKSRFQLSKPEKPSVWPNMATLPQTADQIVVSTPPSVSSSSKPSSFGIAAVTQPVKLFLPPITSVSTSRTASININLNEFPQNDSALSFPITYQRRNINLTVSSSMPCVVTESKKEEEMMMKDMTRYCNQQQRGERSWLALATPNTSK